MPRMTKDMTPPTDGKVYVSYTVAYDYAQAMKDFEEAWEDEDLTEAGFREHCANMFINLFEGSKPDRVSMDLESEDWQIVVLIEGKPKVLYATKPKSKAKAEVKAKPKRREIVCAKCGEKVSAWGSREWGQYPERECCYTPNNCEDCCKCGGHS